MLGEHLGQPSDEATGGFVAGTCDHRRVGLYLLPRELPNLAVFVFELGIEELSHEVVGWMLGAPFDVVGEHIAVRNCTFSDVHRFAGFGAQRRVGLVANSGLVLLGNAEQHADDAHRHHRGELRDYVEAAGTDERVEADHRARVRIAGLEGARELLLPRLARAAAEELVPAAEQ